MAIFYTTPQPASIYPNQALQNIFSEIFGLLIFLKHVFFAKLD